MLCSAMLSYVVFCHAMLGYRIYSDIYNVKKTMSSTRFFRGSRIARVETLNPNLQILKPAP